LEQFKFKYDKDVFINDYIQLPSTAIVNLSDYKNKVEGYSPNTIIANNWQDQLT